MPQVQVLTETSYEDRSFIYEDTVALIDPGFLTHSVVVKGVPFQLRTLGTGDSHVLYARTGYMHATDDTWRNWLVAQSIWMVGGRILLSSEEASVELYELVSELPKTARDTLYYVALGLFNRHWKALNRTEAYCYEADSRLKWRSFGGVFNSSQIGIPGIERIGTNSVQRTWIAFNQLEDQRLEERNRWGGLKMVASAWNPKGIGQLNQRDSDMQDEEDKKRQAVRDKAFYAACGVDVDVAFEKVFKGDKIITANSVEELEEQYKNWVTGKKDVHDMIVDRVKQQQLEALNKERSYREERAAEFRADLDEQERVERGAQPLIGISPEEMLKRIREKRGGKIRKVYDDPRAHLETYRSRISAQQTSGQVSVVGGKIKAPYVDPDEVFGDSSLDEELAYRNPVFKSQE